MKTNTDVVLLLTLLNPYTIILALGVIGGLILYPAGIVDETVNLASSLWDVIAGALGFLIDSAAQIIRYY